jgi:hypothetical protein
MCGFITPLPPSRLSLWHVQGQIYIYLLGTTGYVSPPTLSPEHKRTTKFRNTVWRIQQSQIFTALQLLMYTYFNSRNVRLYTVSSWEFVLSCVGTLLIKLGKMWRVF